MALCTNCGYSTRRWMGFCPQCRSSDTMSEGFDRTSQPVPIAQIADLPEQRLATGVEELDRALGGGVVVGSATLLAGEPGVGKSTLVLGAAAALGRRTLIVSGEESVGQIKMRAGRIGALAEGVSIVAVRDAGSIAALIETGDFELIVIDSIQAVTVPGAAIGSPKQVREAAAELVASAKASGTALIMTGHVTKEGGIAGPRVLEHMVDVVVTIEGDPHRGLRFLRCVKNRYGPVDEVGIFEMTASGLIPVPDASAVLIAGRDPQAPGSVLFPTVDGRRSVIVEIQALVVATGNPQPRRSVKGLPSARVHQILAALERHARLPLGRHEVYVSVMGGLRVSEPAADLAVALALASAASGVAITDIAAWGEVGLTGELRSVPHAARRRAEADRLGIGGVIDGSGYSHLLDAVVESGLAAATVGDTGAPGRRRA
jgi:DNA repair protein RadA/Sms